MDNWRFAKAYPNLPEKVQPNNPERRELLEAPRKWMHFFDDTMKNYLRGGLAPDSTEFTKMLNNYYVWTQTSLDPIITKAREIDEPLSTNDISQEFSFHQINGPVAFLWYPLLFPHTEKLSPKTISDMQAHLAVSIAPYVRKLKLLNAKPSVETHKEQANLTGILTEFDTMITLLELTKQHPELLPLPAPALFESQPRNTGINADFLLVDTEKAQVRGIQVKAHVQSKDTVEHYNKNFISLVDGVHDLGNVVFERSSSRRDQRKALPGQIAVNLLAERSIKNVPYTVNRLPYLKSRSISQELNAGRKSFLPFAVAHLEERIIPELYS